MINQTGKNSKKPENNGLFPDFRLTRGGPCAILYEKTQVFFLCAEKIFGRQNFKQTTHHQRRR